MENWEALQFKLEMNKALNRGTTFDTLFNSEGFAAKFGDFKRTKIGQIWLKTEQGWDYRIWQHS